MSGAVAAGTRVLRIGARGEDVRWVQQRIVGVVVDGVYGPQTAGAVLAWQLEHGLLGDGIVGPRTWRALGSAATAPEVSAPPARASADLVAMVERGLRAAPNTFEPAAWAAVLAPEMQKGSITTPARISAFLANIHNETGGLRQLEELLSYSAEGIVRTWPSRFATVAEAAPYARNPRALANKVYGGRMGNTGPDDGWIYRGRGPMQTTGRANYLALSRTIAVPIEDLVGPESPLITRPGCASSAVVFWTAMGANAMADRGDVRGIRIKANGGTIGLSHVLEVDAGIRAALLA
ncbi:peptidoglycan-binding protein [Rhodovarius lipocyclicus]|uniref:peptidoglycan-binding protein n=1 Tax=Rhodovarius lipocyclicus TaxID=268410 RepID=UPI0013588C33|nr:peptidoglycan-binding protein [Rhodovarius lipocyclicus]